MLKLQKYFETIFITETELCFENYLMAHEIEIDTLKQQWYSKSWDYE